MLAANLSVNWVRYQQIYFLCKISFAYGETWLHMYNDNSAAFQCPWGFILSVAFKLRQSFTRLKMKVKGALSKNCTFYFCYEAKGPLSISVLHTVILMLYRETGIFLFASNTSRIKLGLQCGNSAAIASEAALGLYGLQRVAKNIEDKAGNVTRFVVIGKDTVPAGGTDKTSLLIATKHKAGALFDLLEPFKAQNINLLQLARHPIPGVKWEYLFFIDVEGHQNDMNLSAALKEVESRVSELNVLGSYPAAVL